MNLKTIFNSIILSVSFVGCSKVTEPIQPSKISSASCVPNNPHNTADSAGVYHNQILAVLDQYQLIHPQTSFHSIDQKVDQWGSNKFALTNNVDSVKSDNIIQSVIEDDFAHIINNSKFSSEGKQILFDLFESIKTINSSDYCSLKSTIMLVENSVENSTVSNSEKKHLLAVSSIFRHSLYYWDNFFPNNSSEVYTPTDPMPMMSKRWKRWICGAADALGAVVGASAALSNPVTAITAVNAAILGAGATSGAAGAVIKALEL